MLKVESRNCVEWFRVSEAYPNTSKQYKDGWTDTEVVGLGGLVCGWWWWCTLVSRESCHGVVVTEVVGRGGAELRFKTWWSAWTPTFPPPPSPSICSPSSHGPPSRRNRKRERGWWKDIIPFTMFLDVLRFNTNTMARQTPWHTNAKR